MLWTVLYPHLAAAYSASRGADRAALEAYVAVILQARWRAVAAPAVEAAPVARLLRAHAYTMKTYREAYEGRIV